jgi:hypothetical protein
VEERPFRAASERLSERGFSPGDKKSLGFLRGPSPLIICHPERRAKKRSDRARVEGPLHSCLPTLASGHSHRALFHRTFSRMQASGNLLPPTLFICHPERESKDPALALFPAIPSAFVEERPFRAASERLSERALAPEIRKASDSSKALHHLIICHPERRAKKRSARARVEGPLHSRLPTLASGHPHRASMIELLAVCKRRGTCCRLPYLFVILSASRRTRPRPLCTNRCRPVSGKRPRPHHRGRPAV